MELEVEIVWNEVGGGTWGWWIWYQLPGFTAVKSILAYRDGFKTQHEAEKNFSRFRKALNRTEVQLGRKKLK